MGLLLQVGLFRGERLKNRDIVFEAKVERLEALIREVCPELILKSREELSKRLGSKQSNIGQKTWSELSEEKAELLQDRLDVTADALLLEYSRRKLT